MILVTGGTGFVGRRIVARLVARGEQVRVLSRSPADLPGVESVTGDVADVAAVRRAAQGCGAVIHLVGIIREVRGVTFEAAHVEGTRGVLQACKEAEVPRLLHMSALGSRADARSRYHQTKWRAEELVRASGLAATIFRPSTMFGAGNAFFPQLRDLLHRGPVIPIIGNGKSLLQPIWVEEVVSCFVGALDKPETVGHAYDLGGPERFSFEELVDLLAADEGVRKRKMHLPIALMTPAVAVLSRFIPNFPLTADQLIMLRDDNVCDIAEMRQTFGLEPVRLAGHLRE